MALNILVVDDSAVMRGVVKKALTLMDLPPTNFLEAKNGREALSILEANKVDLALIDVNMPVMNGEEMFARVRQDPRTRRLPVVFVSSETNKGRIDLLESKGSKFIPKPFDAKHLGQTVRRMIEVSREEAA